MKLRRTDSASCFPARTNGYAYCLQSSISPNIPVGVRSRKTRRRLGCAIPTIVVKITAEVNKPGNNIFLANNDCMVRNLLHHLRVKCGVNDEKVVLDLADEEGNLLNLGDYNPRFPANRLLQAKAMYIPILIERNEDNSLKPFTPMAKRVLNDAEFMRNLTDQYERREHARTGGPRTRLEAAKEGDKGSPASSGKGGMKGATGTSKTPKGGPGVRSKSTR